MAPEVLVALKTAAAFGAQCEEELLQILDKAPERIESTVIALDAAVAEGIMNKVGSAYIFAHDQVQQAAYLLIPDSERASFHLLLGRTLWKCCSENELKKHLFVLVYQLHKGSSLISDHDEQVALARLSLRAGEMASAMSAFLPSECYLTAGIRMLNEDDWFCCRDLCVDIFSLCAETQYILGDFDAMQGNLDKLLTNGRTLQEKLRAYHTLILSMGAQGRALDAISTASRILPELGEALPLDVTKAIVKQELGLTTSLRNSSFCSLCRYRRFPVANETNGGCREARSHENPSRTSALCLYRKEDPSPSACLQNGAHFDIIRPLQGVCACLCILWHDLP